MGVEPFLVASTVEAVMAQRLVRKLCDSCREAYQPRRDELPDDFPWDELQGADLYRSKGCRKCRGVGYQGRMGIYELMVTTDEVRQLAHDNASSWKVKQAAIANGMLSLRHDGWAKALSGRTSVEEVLRVTKSDQVLRQK